MSEGLTVSAGTKEERYQELMPQLEAVVSSETDVIANMANMASMLHETFGFWWTGFYRVVDGMLVLGPFQGPLACTRIRKGKGVCGTAWEKGETVVVPDVEQFPGHIACSSESRSEIVVPVFKGSAIVAVLDIDSRELSTFDETDRKYLEKAVALLFS
jgi:GAF domain-containing protein